MLGPRQASRTFEGGSKECLVDLQNARDSLWLMTYGHRQEPMPPSKRPIQSHVHFLGRLAQSQPLGHAACVASEKLFMSQVVQRSSRRGAKRLAATRRLASVPLDGILDPETSEKSALAMRASLRRTIAEGLLAVEFAEMLKELLLKLRDLASIEVFDGLGDGFETRVFHAESLEVGLHFTTLRNNQLQI